MRYELGREHRYPPVIRGSPLSAEDGEGHNRREQAGGDDTKSGANPVARQQDDSDHDPHHWKDHGSNKTPAHQRALRLRGMGPLRHVLPGTFQEAARQPAPPDPKCCRPNTAGSCCRPDSGTNPTASRPDPLLPFPLRRFAQGELRSKAERQRVHTKPATAAFGLPVNAVRAKHGRTSACQLAPGAPPADCRTLASISSLRIETDSTLMPNGTPRRRQKDISSSAWGRRRHPGQRTPQKPDERESTSLAQQPGSPF